MPPGVPNESPDDAPDLNGSRVSRATAQRLSQYLRCLGSSARRGGTVSSEELGQAVRVSAAQVRRDLAALGHLGQRGIGYDSASLAGAIRHTLGIDRPWRAVLVGVGNLARALLRYPAFREQGFGIVGLFDNDPAKLGQTLEGLPVEPLTDLATRLKQLDAELAVLTVPREAAQAVAAQLIAAGIKGLLNFAPVLIHAPPPVRVVSVDLAIQLEQLAFLVQLSAPPAAPGPGPGSAETPQKGVEPPAGPG